MSVDSERETYANGRRGFLRGLLALPLIGGGVTLIGNPTAVAAPVSNLLMERYIAWLALEHRAALVERVRLEATAAVAERAAQGHSVRTGYVEEMTAREGRYPALFWTPDAPDIASAIAAASPSTRAALVLSAVGCGWRRS